jgi:hypothetical protein
LDKQNDGKARRIHVEATEAPLMPELLVLEKQRLGLLRI